MPMTKEQYVENLKKGNAIAADAVVQAEGTWLIINEFLNAIQGVIKEDLESVDGDVNLLYDTERGLLEVYASWDHYNTGDRKTSEQLIEEAKNA